jgi:hypothetical protein
MTFAIFVALFLAVLGQDAPAWQYVVPPADARHEYPPLRTLVLSETKPDDVREAVNYRGKRRRYAQIRYGSPRATRVLVVLDEISPTEIDLYVDANRNRVIEPKEKVTGQGNSWRVRLEVALVDGSDAPTRTLLFRYGRLTHTLSIATCGYLKGSVELGGRKVSVRRMDGDANGYFTDPQDRICFDLGGADKWDSSTEEFLYGPTLQLAGIRYLMQSDQLGTRLTLRKLEGTGAAKLKFAAHLAATVQDASVMLLSRDGLITTLRGAAGEEAIPVGEYRVAALFLTLKDPAGGDSWNYVFTGDGGDPQYQHWYAIAKGQTVAIDPVGALDFGVSVRGEGGVKPGDILPIQAHLYTGDKLLINTAYRGNTQPTHQFDSGARYELCSPAGAVLATSQSGFA